VLLVAALLAIAPAARADPGDSCVTSYEEAQQAKKAGELVRSKANLRLCMGACPRALAGDCEAWLGEVSKSIATLTIHARAADGAPLGAAELAIDGVSRPLDQPLELDPGPHRVHVEGRGLVARTETLTLEAGATVEHAVVIERGGGSATVEREAPSLVGPLVLGGGGLLLLAGAGVLSLIGHLDVSDMRDTCAPSCDVDRVDAVRAMWTAGGVLAAVGGAAVIGSGVWLGIAVTPPGTADARATGELTIAF
jgi:hypothetical protein